MRSVALILAGLLAIGLINQPASSRGTSTQDETSASSISRPASPDEILRAAEEHWDLEQPPHRLRYDIVFHALRNGTPVENHYRALYDSDDQSVKVSRFSTEQKSRPAEQPPNGVNFNVSFTLSMGHGGTTGREWQLSPPPTSSDYIGYPDLAPRYLFGLTLPRKHLASAETSSLLVIGGTRVVVPSYAVSFAADEAQDASHHHLILVPLRDPHKYRVREMWVDRSSCTVDRMILEGNFTQGPSLAARWEIRYAAVAGVQYLKSETALTALDEGRNGEFSSVAFTFENIEPIRPSENVLILSLPAGDDSLREPTN